MIYAAIIAAAAAVIGALIASGDEAKARAVRQSVADKYKDLPLPVLDKVVAQKLGPEAAARYLEETQSTKAQSDVLGKYMDEIHNGGETADDRAAYLRMQQEAAGIANSTQGAVQRQMGNRGLAGSGLSFALQEQGAQAAANRANETGLTEASNARGRYMDALGRAGSMSGQMRGQELQEMSAVDSINEFNARQQSDVDRYNASLPQQQFDNRMTQLAGESNALSGVANDYDRSAGAARQTAGGVGQAAMSAGAAYDQYGNPIKKKSSEAGA